MKLRAKVIATTQQWPVVAWASTSATSVRPDAVLFKFVMNKDYQAELRRRKGLTRTKLALDDNLKPTQ
jgi:hypothetical protein